MSRYVCLGPDACVFPHRTLLEAITCTDRRGHWWTITTMGSDGRHENVHPKIPYVPGDGPSPAQCWEQAHQGMTIRDLGWTSRISLHLAKHGARNFG